MIYDARMPAEKRFSLFLTMVHVGAAATLVLFATLVFDLPDFIDGFPQGVLLMALGVILNGKYRDEYVERLWQAGTAAAFVAIATALLLAPIAIGLVEHALGREWLPTSMAVKLQWPAAIALVGFYAGFYWRMLAGSGA